MISFYDHGKANIKSEIKQSDMNKLENTNHSSNIGIIKIIAIIEKSLKKIGSSIKQKRK